MKYFIKTGMSAVATHGSHWQKNISIGRIKQLARDTGTSEEVISKEITDFISKFRRAGKGPNDSISNLPQLKGPMKSIYNEESRAKALISGGSKPDTVYKEMLPYTVAEYHGKNLKFLMNLNRPKNQLVSGVKKGPREAFMFSPQARHYGAKGKGGKDLYGFQDSIDITVDLNAAFSEVKKGR